MEHQDIKESINVELRPHYQRLVDSYRPDLRDDTPPHPPIFPHLNPYHLNELRETDRREYSVADLLSIQLQESGGEDLPKRVVVLGRSESGKTALFAQIIHYWLHDKKQMKGLSDFELLLGIQCLGLSSVPPPPTPAVAAVADSSKQTAAASGVNLERHILDHLPETVTKYGELKVQQTMRQARVLILIDSLDHLKATTTSSNNNTVDEDTSLSPWHSARVVLFCDYKFMKDNPKHPFHVDQSKEHLVVKLWGGIPINPFEGQERMPESLCDLGGVLSGRLSREYCRRLSSNKRKSSEKFWNYYTNILRYFTLDMRKPFNIYMAMEAFCVDIDFKTETLYELYCKWFDLWSAAYHCDRGDDRGAIINEGSSLLARLAYEAFYSDSQSFPCGEDVAKNSKVMPFLKHFLMSHYNPEGKVVKFSFRIDAHRLYFAARQLVERVKLNVGRVELELLSENYKKLEPILPMVLGVARESIYNEQIKNQALKIIKPNLDDHRTNAHFDPIINYAVSVLSETKLYVKKENKFDEFVVELVKCLPRNNWTIVDGNVHPEALRGLCECGHDGGGGAAAGGGRGSFIPQRVNITLDGLENDTPQICDLMAALKNCDLRICLSHKMSYLSGGGEFALDETITSLYAAKGTTEALGRGTGGTGGGGGRASLATFTGYIRNTKLFDAHPTTRRIYKLCLRITNNTEYENLRDLCKISHKLTQVFLRISHTANLHHRRLKELSASVAKLTVYLEGYTDDHVEAAVTIWRSVHGSTAQRDVAELRFWFTDRERMTPTGVCRLIESDLPGTRVELSLEQPVSDYDKSQLQHQLNKCKSDNYLIRLLGSVQYKRVDMKKERD